MTTADLNRRIVRMKQKRKALWDLSQHTADLIFDAILESEDLSDQIAELILDHETTNPPSEYNIDLILTHHADYTDLVWFHILAILTEKVRATSTPRFPR